jgi:hypothetical protein
MSEQSMVRSSLQAAATEIGHGVSIRPRASAGEHQLERTRDFPGIASSIGPRMLPSRAPSAHLRASVGLQTSSTHVEAAHELV